MQCPIDGETLVISERQGIEIDHCPRCRGVWLDRGELDKLIERSAIAMGPSSPEGYRDRDEASRRPEPRFGTETRPRHDDDDDDDRSHRPGEQGKPRKRRSFLDDLFDFG